MSTPLRILIVEDSEDDITFLLRQLQRGGYDVVAHKAVHTADAMRAALAEAEWDIVVSDYSMPQFNGLNALRILQQTNLDLPFIIVSGSIGEATAVEIMKAGAHDYLMKDNLARFVPAVERELNEAAVRRAKRQAEEDRAALLVREQTARAEAEAANRAKDEFVATLSHELRTPLTPITGWVRMIRGGMLSGENAAHALYIIDKNAQLLLRLINDLLDMSAILSGKMRIEQTSVDLAEVLADAIETVRPLAEERGIKLELDSDVTTTRRGAVLIPGDRMRLVQIFWNLLNNATKFSLENSSVKIACRVTDGGTVRVEIEDEGQGIAPDFLPHIFEHFRQADSSNTRTYGGMGIGLALVKSLVGAHGGTVEGASAGTGRGSKFTVELPLFNKAENPFAATHAPDGQKQNSDASSAHILIVEDAPDTLDMLRATFESRGYRTTLCQSADEARRVAISTPFDVIISDIRLPETDGCDLIKQLRAYPHLRNTPAVALTGYASQHDIERAIAAGYNAHLAKPFDPSLLLMQVEQQLLLARRMAQPLAPDAQ
jgi:signal transduction histidine kinase